MIKLAHKCLNDANPTVPRHYPVSGWHQPNICCYMLTSKASHTLYPNSTAIKASLLTLSGTTAMFIQLDYLNFSSRELLCREGTVVDN